MNEIKVQAILDGMTAIARKVLPHVPDNEPLAVSRIHAAVSAECNHDYHTTRGCLRALADAGLIRQVSKDRYQRKVEVPGPRTLKSLQTPEVPAPKLGDLMRPALAATNPAQPIPAAERANPQKESALKHMEIKTDPVTRTVTGETSIAQTLAEIRDEELEQELQRTERAPFSAQSDVPAIEMNVGLPEGVYQIDPLAQMADLANQLLDATAEYGNRVKKITKDLEDIALAIEAEREQNSKAAKQLAKFRKLLDDAAE